ncbi:MAG: hypothetical protein BWK77_04485 [Verrucomicrobia bacterium A1]|nr:MAG: hypothetical protein BWK77_04485 [Verrucomicrobia bacterium A1]
MLRFSTGLGRRLNDQWMVMALVSPTLYKFDDIGANDFGISGGLTAMWNYSPSLTFMFGLMVASDSDRPVMPALGVNWAINEMLDLNLMFPRPRLVYRPDEHLSLHLGVDMKRATFRTSDTLGTSIGLPQYNDALGNYRDIRLGAGVDYTFTHSLSVEAEAGYSVNRQIDYTQIDERVEFDPAPYFRLGVKVSF